MAGLPRGTVTFLFCDVEGSTRLLRELGQEPYGQALAGYRRLLRESCTGQGGHEVDTQGDAIFFAFQRARDAVGAAAQAQRLLANHDWPEGASLRARIGLHTGEASLADGRYVGLSVHRAARVCAAAAGGQVLLSQATASMLEDEELGELRLRELGRHPLKDFERPVQLHQLDVPGLPTRFPQPKTARRRKLGRKHVLLAAALAALAGAAVAIPLTLTGGGSTGASRLGPTSAGVIDPKTNRLAAEIPLGFRSSLIAAGEGYVWIADPKGSILTRIDPKTRNVVEPPFPIEAGAITTGIAVGGGSVWVGVIRDRGHSLAVLELGPELGDLRRTIVLAREKRRTFSSSVEPVLLAFGGGTGWVLEAGAGEVSRLDPKTGKVSTLADGVNAGSIAYGHGAVWLGGRTGVTRIDARTGALRELPLAGLLTARTTSLAIGPDAVWFAGSTQPKLFSIDPRATTFTTYEVGRGPRGVALGEDAVWVANGVDGTVSRVNPESGDVETIPLGSQPGGIVAAYGAVWTSPGEATR